jgi:dolichol-phosphate mannosyltransferase
MRLIKLATDGIFAFSIVPIRAAALIGAFVIFLSSLFVMYALYAKIFEHKSPQGFTALLVAITFLAGVVLFFLGVIGEYVGRIYEETKGRPQYVIWQRAGKSAIHKNTDRGDAVTQQFVEKELLR